MNTMIRMLVCLVCAGLVCSCSDQESPVLSPEDTGDGPRGTGTIIFDISFKVPDNGTGKAALVESINKVAVYVYRGYADPFYEETHQDLAIVDNHATGSIVVRARDDYLVEVVCFSDSTVLYLGRDSDVDVPSGGQTTAVIVLEHMGMRITTPAYALVNGNYLVTWTEVPFVNEYIVEEADNPSFTGAVIIHDHYSTSDLNSHDTDGITYYYRGRVRTDYGYAPWSTNTIKTEITLDTGEITIDITLPSEFQQANIIRVLPGTTAVYPIYQAQVVVLGTASSDEQEEGVYHEWSQVNGPETEINNAEMSNPYITPYEPGNYEFQDIVRDHNGTVIDSQTVTVVITAIDPDDIGITIVDLPDGIFLMGYERYYYAANVSTDIIDPFSATEHTVELTGFSISSTEITQLQFKTIMKGFNPSYFRGDTLPVDYISWRDAIDFCNRLSQACGLECCYDVDSGDCDLTKNGFRLPTEAEWEYACRAGTTTLYYTGNDWDSVKDTSWNYYNSGGKTHPVGLKEPNNWGLFDMMGNVFEYCNDWFDRGYYYESPRLNPTGPTYGSHKVSRGGSYRHANHCLWSGYRGKEIAVFDKQYVRTPDERGREYGFRIVRRP